MMDTSESLSHTKWECKYHVVFIPKCRRKVLYNELRQHLGEVCQLGMSVFASVSSHG
jgi:putative transposase